MSDQKQQPGQINIELDEKTAEGTYSNLAIINHSSSEFVVDFVAMMPGAPKAKVKSRIVLTPQHAKRLLKALGENIGRFESAHGTINDTEQPSLPLSFGPAGQA
ncbi:DUF3467 domain-containing protein [Flavobacterium salilacus subsp. salilacus]|uniref:DUF3467 domain-containing protein n=1 Tax=Flavobacterium TaxID=237 RepID=UPI001074B97E|nr:MULTISPECIES: DUF3467 domain-containing protein [Flavobacterium]KAF2519520.1 DUF3467 domain-containing protein [Flavobacterium salilacus subsp. salilacus]MBE1614582.1 DUF3467 domain-containing protein [Flavobacterium sp. SaA2.13]NDI98359.1 DUF3467 domain-containing protein [Flavobacterium salilacus subsp. altitudinum]